MERLRQNPLELCYTPIYSLPPNFFKIYFHNIQSLHLHHSDIIHDENILASDLLMFVESKLCSLDDDDEYEIPSFQLHRNDHNVHRSPYGTAIYSKAEHLHTFIANFKQVEIQVALYKHCQMDLQVVCVYCRPRSKSLQ